MVPLRLPFSKTFELANLGRYDEAHGVAWGEVWDGAMGG